MKTVTLFDLGGTLAYYYDLPEFSQVLRQCVEAVHNYLSKENMLRVSSREIWSRVREEDHESADYRSRPLEERLRRIFHLSTSVTEETMMVLCRHFMNPIFARAQCYEDTLPALNHLKSRGYRIGLVSNTSWGSPVVLWREETRRLGLDEFLDECVFCRDVGWRKPDRRIFEFALQKLRARAEECVFIGDEPKWDVIGPRAVGIDSILIDRRGATKAINGLAIRNLNELPAILERI